MATRCFWPPESWCGLRRPEFDGQFDGFEQALHLLAGVGGGQAFQAAQGAGDGVADAVAGVEGGFRVLEHHLQPPAQLGLAALDRQVGDGDAAEFGGSGAGGLQPGQDAGQGRLAAAALADDGQGAARLGGEADVFERDDAALGVAEHGLDLIGFAEAVDAQQRRRVFGRGGGGLVGRAAPGREFGGADALHDVGGTDRRMRGSGCVAQRPG